MSDVMARAPELVAECQANEDAEMVVWLTTEVDRLREALERIADPQTFADAFASVRIARAALAGGG